MNLVSTAVRAWRRLGLTRPRYPRLMFVESVDDIPATTAARVVVCVGDPGAPKWVGFDCPCGRGHQVLLTLQVTHRPRWRLTIGGDRVSIAPSIDRQEGPRRCHFWLEDGRVRWA